MESKLDFARRIARCCVFFHLFLLVSIGSLHAQDCKPVLNGAKFYLAFECLNDSTVLVVDSSKVDEHGWQYSDDSTEDGVTFGQIGGGDFEIYGMAIKETTEHVHFVINSNLPLQGFFSNSAQDGNIGWGDIFIDLSTDSFKESNYAKSFFAIRFADTNDSEAPTAGVYSSVSAKSVTKINSGFNNWAHYRDFLANKGYAAVLGDLGHNQIYYSDELNLNVIDQYQVSGELDFLSISDLMDLNFNMDYFPGKSMLAVRFRKSIIIDECGVVGGDGSSCRDCSGVSCGGKQLDQCGVCGGNGTSCLDCKGAAFGQAKVDICGVCDGDGSSCLDCQGNPFGVAKLDRCGVCNGDGLSCISCKQENHSVSLFKLDGAGASLKKIAYDIAKKLRKNRSYKGSKKIARNLIAAANQHYIDTWSSAWSIASNYLKCEESKFCQVFEDRSGVDEYAKTLSNFVNFINKSIRSNARLIKTRSYIKQLRQQVRQVEQAAQAELVLIPVKNYKCDIA